MKNKKIFKIMNIILAVGMIIGGIGLSVYYFTQKEYVRVFSCLSIIVTIGLPLLIRKTKFKLNEQDTLLYYLFLLVAHFLGCGINLYKYISWYDLFAHCLSGILTFYLAYYILDRLKLHNKKRKLVNFLFCIGFVALVAVLWEFVEFFGDVILHTNFQHNLDSGVIDTMGDLLICMIGGLFGYGFYLFSLKCNKD